MKRVELKGSATPITLHIVRVVETPSALGFGSKQPFSVSLPELHEINMLPFEGVNESMRLAEPEMDSSIAFDESAKLMASINSLNAGAVAGGQFHWTHVFRTCSIRQAR